MHAYISARKKIPQHMCVKLCGENRIPRVASVSIGHSTRLTEVVDLAPVTNPLTNMPNGS